MDGELPFICVMQVFLGVVYRYQYIRNLMFKLKELYFNLV
jgi:hypothetical protein